MMIHKKIYFAFNYSLLFVLFLYTPAQLFGQKSELSAKRELSMSEVTASSSSGTYRYYKKGESKPYTGILFARWENGHYKSRQEYEDGVGQGIWINYWPNGNLKEVGTYDHNKVEGPIKKYYETGNLKAEGNYKDWRIRVGEWRYYSESGELIKTENYGEQGDFRDVEEYFNSGQISKERYEELLKR